MLNKRPLFVVIEGSDGAGKTTLIPHVVSILQANGYGDVLPKQALTGGPVGKAFYASLKTGNVSELNEVLSMAAAINETYMVDIAPALDAGSSIVCDRWIPSYYAYQCYARGVSLAFDIVEYLYETTKPDLYIHCKVDRDVAMGRMAARKDNNYLDDEAELFKQRVSQGYVWWFSQENKTVPVIDLDCNQSLEAVANELQVKLLAYLKEKETQ